jgi:flagellin
MENTMNSINTNLSALTAQANMQKQSKEMESAMERLSSGLRINSAADDAAGSAIASKMESQVRSLGVAVRNANDAISLTQTAEGALGEVENILQRMRELSVQAGNSTLNTGDRSQIQNEINQLAAEIDSISSKTNFNSVSLLNGSNDKVTMQIGVNASDSLDIKLQKTDVSSLGVGNSGATSSSSTLTTSRITVIGTTDILTSDVKINGQDWTASDFDVNATSIDGTSTDLTGALDANTLQATGIAQKINENSGVHGVTATAFNEITTSTSNYSGAAVTINTTVITASGSKEIFVGKVNDTVVGITAELLSDGKIKFSNNDGASIEFGDAAAAVIGIADDNYGGFVRLQTSDGSAIKVEAGSKANGYGASAAGVRTDMSALGLNETNVNASGKYEIKGAGPVDGTILQAANGLKINGVTIDKLDTHATGNFHATDKIAAINQFTSETGVTASGTNAIKVTVDLNGATKANHDKAAIDGITVDLSSAVSMNLVVSAINSAVAGKSNTVASTDGGFLILSNNTGGTITISDSVDTDGDGELFTALTYLDGSATTTTITTGDASARGFITLTSDSSAPIKVEDGYADGDSTAAGMVGGARIGFESQNELGTGSAGVNVGTVTTANASLTALDAAIEKVASFRSSFGAIQNRLDASINNLTTLKVNTDAARSRIEDADFANETSKMTKSQILSQAATSMLAQANASKQNLLALLQG